MHFQEYTDSVLKLTIVLICVGRCQSDLKLIMDRIGSKKLCGHLHCWNQYKHDNAVSSISAISVYNITHPQVTMLMAAVPNDGSGAKTNNLSSSVITGAGRIDGFNAELSVNFSSSHDCEFGSFRCEMEFVDVNGQRDLMTVENRPNSSNQCTCGAFDSQLPKLDDHLGNDSREFNSLRHNKTALSTELSDLRQEITAVSSIVADLNEDYTTLSTELSYIRQNHTALFFELGGFKEDNKGMFTELNSIKHDITSLSTELSAISQNNKVISSELKELRQNVTALSIELLGLRKENIIQSNELIALRNDNTVMSIELDDLRHNKTVMTTELADLRHNNTVMTTELADLRQNNTILSTELADLRQKNTVMTTELADLSQNNTVLSTELADLRQKNTVLSTELADLEQDNLIMTVELVNLRQQNSDLQLLLQNLSSQAPLTQNSLTSLQPTPSTTSLTTTSPTRGYLLHLMALDKPLTGDTLGIRSADYECHRQARRSGLRGTYRAFLSSEAQNLKSIINSNRDRHVPIVNSKNQILFSSWNEIVNGSGARFNRNVSIYSFEGRDIMTNMQWPQKIIWHASDERGVFVKNQACNNWLSRSPLSLGRASSLLQHKLLGQQELACNNSFIVLCIENTAEYN